MVAEVVCASNNDVFKARILSSTMFMAGVSTIAMNVLGIRSFNLHLLCPKRMKTIHAFNNITIFIYWLFFKI
jgi:hypothetical protein